MRTQSITARPRRWRIAGLVAGLALTAVACGDDDSIAQTGVLGTGTTGADDGSDSEAVLLTARSIAFDLDRIDGSAGDELTISFANEDEGIPHNVHVRAGEVDAKTEISPGPDTQTLSVTIDEPGTYTFVCDVHPAMAGNLVVS